MSRLVQILLPGLVSLSAYAQDLNWEVIVNARMVQNLDNNIRLDSPAGPYFPLHGAFKENGITVSRVELYLNGKVTENLGFHILFDPSVTTSQPPKAPLGNATTAPAVSSIMWDAYLIWKPAAALTFRIGQFKPLQTYESHMPNPELLMWDRSMLCRLIGDRRDRGIMGIYTFGDPQKVAGKAYLGVMNGSSDRDFGQGNDLNAAKDAMARLEFSLGSTHLLGAYGRWGSTDQKDDATLQAYAFPGGGPDAATVMEAKDRTTNLGLFYRYESPRWTILAEGITGRLGRRWPSMGLSGPSRAGREHLDQRFLGYVATAAYKLRQDAFTLRYDLLDMNAGNDWYGSNPYLSPEGDRSPRYVEITTGWNHHLKPERWRHTVFKLNYIWRKKNFLLPRPGQVGLQGSDSLVATFQVGF